MIIPQESWEELQSDIPFWPADLKCYVRDAVVPVKNMAELIEAVFSEGDYY